MTTRTENRLADALGARASAVSEESLRPLGVASPAVRDHEPRSPWRWIAPLAAATSVALIATVVAYLAPRSQPAQPASSAPFAYYVWQSALPNGRIGLQVRSTATGAMVATVPEPRGTYGWQWAGAQAGFHSYVAVASCRTCGYKLTVYRFRLTAAGRVTGLRRLTNVRPIPDRKQLPGSFSLAPDGSELAYTDSGFLFHARQPEVVIINLMTGATKIWRGGLSRPGSDLQLGTLSWSSSSNELAFTVARCPGLLGFSSHPQHRAGCTPWTVRSLNPAARGGLLTSGSVLMRRDPQPYNSVPGPVLSPSGEAILQTTYPVWLTPGAQVHLNAIRSISTTTGRQQVLRRWRSSQISQLISTGGIVLVWSEDMGGGPQRVIGWIGASGTFRPLPWQSG
jgi:hypothetical protein